LMEQHRCPSRDVNKMAHKKFLNNFERLQRDFEAQGPTTSLLLDMRRLVGDWLASHICSVDKNLGQCPSIANGSRMPALQGRS
jgi:hemerythrin